MRGALGPCDDQPMAKTVLIVDDHAPFRALARALLQLEGFEVVGEAGEMVVEDAPAVTPRAAGRTRPVPRQTPPPGRTVDMQCGSGWAVPAGLAGWSEPGNQAKGGDSW
jgi:hypothetical protein